MVNADNRAFKEHDLVARIHSGRIQKVTSAARFQQFPENNFRE
jgi:hypothetical protein